MTEYETDGYVLPVARALEATFYEAPSFVHGDKLYLCVLNKVTLNLDFYLVAENDSFQEESSIEQHQIDRRSLPYRPAQAFPDCLFANPKPWLFSGDFKREMLDSGLEYHSESVPQMWAGVPLLSQGNVFGLLFVINESQQGDRGDDFLRFLSAMANQASSYLTRARLIKNLEAINNVGTTLTSGIRLQREQVLELIYSQLRLLMNTDSMFIAFFDEERHRLDFPFAVEDGLLEKLPSRDANIEDLSQGGLTEFVLRNRSPLLISNVPEWCRSHGIDLPIKPIPISWLGVPMVVGNKIIGIISLRNQRIEGLYDFEDLRVLDAMAKQSAIALDNALLYYRTNKRLEALTRVGRALSAGIELDAAQMLLPIRDETGPIMDRNNMYIALFDSKHNELSFPVAMYNDEPQLWESRRVDINDEYAGGLTEAVLRSGESLCPTDVEAEYLKRRLKVPIPPVPKSWLGVPIKSGLRSQGVIAVQSDEYQGLYDTEDEQILSAMADQAAIALDNALLIKQNREWSDRLEKLYLLGLKVNSGLELDEILLSVAQGICDLLCADTSAIFPYDSDTKSFLQGVRAGSYEEKLSRPSSSGLAMNIVRSASPVFKSEQDLSEDEAIKIDNRRIQAFAGIPLMSSDNCVGVLFIDFFAPYEFSEDDKHIAQLFSQQAANAISNARQFKKIKEYERVQRFVDLGELASQFAHRIGNRGGIIRIKATEIEDYAKTDLENDTFILERIESILRNNKYLIDLSTLLFKPLSAAEEEMASTDVSLFVLKAIQEADIPGDVELDTILEPWLPRIKGNRFFIEVFLEIIQNAVDAMRNSVEKKLTIKTAYDGDWVVVTFSDTGPGVKQQDRNIIFDLFKSGPPSEKHTKHHGFGLWWVRTFLRRIGGDIELSNTDRIGATFAVKLMAENGNE